MSKLTFLHWAFGLFRVKLINFNLKASLPYLFAVIGEGTGILVNFLMFALIQHRYGVEQLSIYMIMRRTISMILPAVMAGVPLSLIRHLSVQEDPLRIGQMVTLGLLIPACLTSILMVLAGLFPGFFARSLLGDKIYAEYVSPLLFALASMAFALVVSSISKGLHRITLATSLNILFFSVVPLTAYLVSNSLSDFFINYALGLFMSGILLLAYLVSPVQGGRPFLRFDLDFVTFGIKGALSEFLMMFLLWLPPFIIATSYAIEISGYFSLMMSLVLVTSSPIAPIASIVMPKFSRHLHLGQVKDLRILFFRTLALLGALSVPLFLASLLTYEYLAEYLLPGVAPLGQKATAVLLTASIPAAVFYGFRNMLDVAFTPTRNLLNIFIALAVFALVFLGIIFVNPLQTRAAVVTGFTAAMWALGGFTLWYAHRASK